jgi:class 3 adenylate cyclase
MDVTSELVKVKAPTLLVDVPTSSGAVLNLDLARSIVSTMPDARLLSSQIQWDAFPPETVDEILAFLGVDIPPRALRFDGVSGIRTVLFTDLVGHTEMMRRLGDERGRAVLREHERITREVLKQYGGDEIKTMGDGFMASFGSASRAVECAIALQKAFAEHNADVGAHGDAPLNVRVGLNAGEPIAEDGDLFGSTVILASRVCAQAGAGKILIPEPVRHLLTGKDFLFADRGEVTLKGFEDAYRLFEVRW